MINKTHLHIWIEAKVTQALPVRARLKAQFVQAREEILTSDEPWTASIFICCPKNINSQQAFIWEETRERLLKETMLMIDHSLNRSVGFIYVDPRVFDGGYPTLIMFQIIILESSRCRLSAILAAGTPSPVFSTWVVTGLNSAAAMMLLDSCGHKYHHSWSKHFIRQTDRSDVHIMSPALS